VRSALGNVPPEVVTSAVGHAVLVEALVQIAADILDSQENSTLMRWLLDSSAQRGPLPGLQSPCDGSRLIQKTCSPQRSNMSREVVVAIINAVAVITATALPILLARIYGW
jgi:hypothetical protein